MSLTEKDVVLVAGYCRCVIDDEAIPIDITNIILLFLRIVYDFDIIDKKYDKKDFIEIDDETDVTRVEGNGVSKEVVAVVISINSGAIKAGFAGNDQPSIAVPNIIAKHKNNNEILIGHQVQGTMLLNASNPIQNGDIKDWDGFQAMILRILRKLMENKTEFAVLMSECAGFSKESREKMTTFMFKQVGVVGFYSYPRAILSLYASGRTTGIVIVSDYHCTEIVPIYEGCIVNESMYLQKDDATIKINIGRRDVLRYLQSKSTDTLKNKNDAFDILYDPKLLPSEEQKGCTGIHKGVYQSINKCDVDIRRDFYANMVLAGINTVDFDNISCNDEKSWHCNFQQKVSSIDGVHAGYKLKVILFPERAESVWIGGSILAILATFETMWMNKNEYEENGASYINKKVST
eukprot:488087_1